MGTFYQQTASQEERDSTEAFRKSSWRKEKKDSSNAQAPSETFMTEFFGTLLARQRRWAYDTKMINQSASSSKKRVHMFCFNCGRPECAIRRCKAARDYEKIRRNLTEWTQKKGLDGRFKSVNTTEYIKRADSDDELLKVMLWIASEKDDDNAEKEYEPGYILHKYVNTPEESTSNIDNIFFLITLKEKKTRNFATVVQGSNNGNL